MWTSTKARKRHLLNVHFQKTTDVRKRKYMDIKFKSRVVAEMERWRRPDSESESEVKHKFVWGATTAVAKMYGVNKWDVSRWMKKSEVLQETAKTKKRTNKTVVSELKVLFFEQEEMLYDAVYIRRQLLGLWVDRYWLQAEFHTILELTKPEGYLDFKYSSGWVSDFCSRWGISNQARTNKKDVPIAVKEPVLKRMHQAMYKLQAALKRDPIYGRFGPLHMFHADQSPSEYAMPGSRTLNISGTPCWMWQPGSGLDKRFITIHLCIRAGGPQIIKPVIIFRGQGISMSQHEIDELNSLTNIRWYFQPKAWADGKFCAWWLRSFRADLKEAGVEGEVLLGLDGLKAQCNQSFFDAAAADDIVPFYTPPDCTDVAAPCDHHIFVRLNNIIKKFYQAESQINRDAWASCSDNGSLVASNKRIKLAKWLSDAWGVLCSGADSEEYFKASFTSTGFLMKLDNPDELIKIKGLPNYTIQ